MAKPQRFLSNGDLDRHMRSVVYQARRSAHADLEEVAWDLLSAFCLQLPYTLDKFDLKRAYARAFRMASQVEIA